MGGVKLPSPPAIEAISRLADLENLAAHFQQLRGYAPESISHWDPKPEFRDHIESAALQDTHQIGSLVEYVYSGYVDVDPRIRQRLRESSDRSLLLTPSGTTSIANVLAYLKNIGCEHLHIVAPSYFAVEAVAKTLDIKLSFSEVSRHNGEYFLPNLTGLPFGSAVWFTFPVYAASCDIQLAQIAKHIDSLPENSIVVVDEGLAFSDRPSLSATRTNFRIIRIATPHRNYRVWSNSRSINSGTHGVTGSGRSRLHYEHATSCCGCWLGASRSTPSAPLIPRPSVI